VSIEAPSKNEATKMYVPGDDFGGDMANEVLVSVR
jgi:hypothetical protein